MHHLLLCNGNAIRYLTVGDAGANDLSHLPECAHAMILDKLILTAQGRPSNAKHADAFGRRKTCVILVFTLFVSEREVWRQ